MAVGISPGRVYIAGLERDVAAHNDHGDSAARDRGSHRGFQRTRHLRGSRYQLAVVTASLEQKFGMRLLENRNRSRCLQYGPQLREPARSFDGSQKVR